MLKLKQARKARKQYEPEDELVLVMDTPDLDAMEHEAFRLNTEVWLDEVLGLGVKE
jgi:hypothetical protein